MKNSTIIALLLLAVLSASCSGRVKFDRIETTPLERYSIVYKDAKCGLYDNQHEGMIAIESTTNEPVEIMFPKEQVE